MNRNAFYFEPWRQFSQCLSAQVREYPTNYMVEEMPLVENADPAVSFSRYIQEEVDKPSLHIPASVSGRVVVHFWIDTAGKVVDPEIRYTET